MSSDFKKYLATEVLSEQRTVSYRNVSRALKVHVNAAKCMLYEFYGFQNEKKPGSVYATYLLSGVKKRQQSPLKANGALDGDHKQEQQRQEQEFEDEPIPSSPPPFTSSMLEPSQQSDKQPTEEGEEREQSPQVRVRTITLVREESLKEIKEQYETISSIHLYSLSPARIQDLVSLTDVGRGLFTDVFAKEDPLEHGKRYGIIQNPEVRRRKGKRPIISQGPAPKFQPVREDAKNPPPRTSAQSSTRQKQQPSKNAAEDTPEEASRPGSRDSTSTTNTPSNNKQPPPSLKRGGSSDLFKAFAKQGNQKPKTSSLAKQDPDTVMKDDDDDDEGESEDEALFLDTGKRTTKKRASDVKKEREDKAAKLRKMMDSDDEEEAEPGVVPANAENENATGTDAVKDEGDEEEVAWSDSDTEKQNKKEASTEKDGDQANSTTATAGSEPKRRRGKRKVTKKRTVKDEDGYLVTKEEVGWESYSEEEPEPAVAPVKKVAPPKSTTTSSFGSNKSQNQSAGSQKGGAGGGGAKSAPKKGGNIMSFFGKKNA
ncbi:uncharacterized protein PV06_08679 [Exophiala oligosperma]|uniref:DNA polymerase delta subunit 3 n=1 Tax=Exophiala oligosperma TaxID=215243 RepID=A0A0D2DTB6_9EURO|nr:uncharacterized protein PV06_08679 [Exophiala oligosperma]KIW38849.1 hypothetical protein PV06_08679 [Exophiala oligosperma]